MFVNYSRIIEVTIVTFENVEFNMTESASKSWGRVDFRVSKSPKLLD